MCVLVCVCVCGSLISREITDDRPDGMLCVRKLTGKKMGFCQSLRSYLRGIIISKLATKKGATPTSYSLGFMKIDAEI